MNYMAARALSDGTGWHMTVQNDDRIWTATCCRTMVPATAEDVERLDWIYNGSLKVGDPISGPAHEAHATKEEAEECFHLWRLGEIERTLEFDDAVFGSWQGCEAKIDGAVCDEPTKGGARYRDHWPQQVGLCPAHRTLEHVLAQVGRVTQSSYS